MRLAEYVDRYRAYNRNAPRRQAPALDAVKRSPGPLRVVAKAAGCDPKQASQALAKLNKKGLVKREGEIWSAVECPQ